jgi:DNA-binding PadR family transcriptional regulator
MALGTLARYGQQHGHQIRRIAEVTNVGEWGGVSVGALYRELRVMERDGLVERVRTEQVGRRPERTVYQITAEGHLELLNLREQAIGPAALFGPDPIGVALSFASFGIDREELRATLHLRRDRLALRAQEVAAERERLIGKGYVGILQAGVMRRGQLILEAEVRWHDELDKALTTEDPLLGNGPALAGADAADAPEHTDA